METVSNWNNVDNNYFLYGHYKEDNKELFYIGIGRKRKGTFYMY